MSKKPIIRNIGLKTVRLQDLSFEMLTAIHQEDINSIERIAKNEDVLYRKAPTNAGQSFTPLEYALIQNKSVAIKILLKHYGAKRLDEALASALNLSDPQQKFSNIRLEAIKYILDKKKADGKGILSLDFAHFVRALQADLEDGEYKYLKFLIQVGADTNVQDEHGSTILHYIIGKLCFANNTTKAAIILKLYIKVILESNIDTNAVDRIGVTPLYLSIRLDDPQIINMVAARSDINKLFHYKGANTNTSALIEAAKVGNIKSVQALLSNTNIKIDLPNSSKQTALYIAVAFNQIESERLLLKNGANPNSPTLETRCTALHHAVMNQNYDMVELLLHNKANVHLYSVIGTPLHYLVDNSKKHTIITSAPKPLTSESDMASEQFYSDIKEHNAKIKNHNGFKILKLLTQYGADTNALALGGVNLLHLAIHAKNFKMLQILLEHPDYRDSSVKLLNMPDDFGDIPLHYVVKKNLTNASQYLISKFPKSIEYTDIYGSTAILIATLNGNRDLVRYLCNIGANLNAKNDIGQTSLHIAVIKQDLNSVIDLLKYGADLQIQDIQSYTPLHLAISNQNSAIVQALLNHLLTKTEIEEKFIDSLLSLADQIHAVSILNIIGSYKEQLKAKGTLKEIKIADLASKSKAPQDSLQKLEISSSSITPVKDDNVDSEIELTNFDSDYQKKLHCYYQEQKKSYSLKTSYANTNTYWVTNKGQKITTEDKDLTKISDNYYVMIDYSIINDSVASKIVMNAAKKGFTSYGPGIKNIDNKLYEIKTYDDSRLYTTLEYVDYTGKFKLLYFCNKTDHKGIRRQVQESPGIEVISYSHATDPSDITPYSASSASSSDLSYSFTTSKKTSSGSGSMVYETTLASGAAHKAGTRPSSDYSASSSSSSSFSSYSNSSNSEMSADKDIQQAILASMHSMSLIGDGEHITET